MTRLRRLLPSRWLPPIVGMLGVAALAIIVGQALFSPGPLNIQGSGAPLGGVLSHGELSRSCNSCHAPPWSRETMADRCLDCHAEVKSDIQKPHGLHSRLLPPETPLDCGRGCHTEHRGAQAPVTLITEKHLDLQERGFSLEGHQNRDDGSEFACTDCHPVALDLFEEADCDTCHSKREPEFMAAHSANFTGDCRSCHDGIDTYGEAFDHDRAPFPLLGGHAALPCEDCHSPAQTILDLQSAPTGCSSCHQTDDVHESTAPQECNQCHDVAAWSPVDPSQISYDHTLQALYPLVDKHLDAACNDCHAENVFDATPADCFSCHQKDDVHKNTAPQECNQCHDVAAWSPVDSSQISYDHALQTDYPLVDKHQEPACNDCHAESIFDPTPTDCFSCHQKDDVHENTAPQECNQCHDVAAWSPVDPSQISYDHTLQTDYPLIDKHREVACNDCHAESIFDPTPTDCFSCHQKDDVHENTAPQECNQCHEISGWSPVDPAQISYDHTLQADYPLIDKHREVACNDCHAESIFTTASTTCLSCHVADDVHLGSFGPACEQCHSSSAWRPATYDRPHSFPITHEGARSRCAQCHLETLLTYTCYAGCHEHTPSNVASDHRSVPPSELLACATCHPRGK